MRTPSYDPTELERQIGPIGSTQITSTNRGLVQNWLVAKGVPSATVKRMKLNTLWKVYNKERYLAAVLRHASGKAPNGADEQAEDVEFRDDHSETPDEPTPALPVPSPAPNGPASDKLALAIKLAELMSGGTAQLDEERVIALIKEHAPKPATFTVEVQKPDGTVKPQPGPHHKQFPQIIRAVRCGNVFLRGPAGSGKTTLAEQCAKALDVPFYFTGAVASEYKLTGFVDAKGAIVRTPFREAYEHGGLFLFDEIDASSPASLLCFNAALANGHMDFPDKVVSRHDGFHCIAAANTFGQGADRVYVGRNQLDGATLDRFLFIDLEYDEALERALSGNDAWVDRVQAVRKSIETLKLRHVISPRASIMGARLLTAGASQTETERETLWRGLDAETVSKIKANA